MPDKNQEKKVIQINTVDDDPSPILEEISANFTIQCSNETDFSILLTNKYSEGALTSSLYIPLLIKLVLSQQRQLKDITAENTKLAKRVQRNEEDIAALQKFVMSQY